MLDENPNGTKITLTHTNLPEGQGESYKQGWDDFYFTPMRAYFSK
jgi:activator of HSP90 ATPase